MKRPSRLAILMSAVLLLGCVHSARANVVTGSFYIHDGVTAYPALFEIRTGLQGQFLLGYLLWDVFYPVTGATLNGDGSIKTIEAWTPDLLDGFTFDLDQQEVVSASGSGVALGTIKQTVGPGRLPFNPTLRMEGIGGKIELTWDSAPGQSYQIESRPTIDSPWNIEGIVNASTTTSLWQGPIDPNAPQQFYRLTKPISINGITLSPADILALEQIYGAIYPGNYWYDSVSGLYGAAGYAAYGQILPGHHFGALASDASIGNTGVVLNGRELTVSEWWIWSLMLKTPLPSGSYWLDGHGNYGIGPVPSVFTLAGNLYDLAKQNNYQPGQGGSPSGQGAGGDQFWSSQYAAGNSENNGSVGYIDVGGDFVDWGM
jgi:hypothetical protein